MGSKQVSGGWVREARAAALAETGDMEGAAKQQEGAIATYQKEFKDQVERLEHSVSCAEKRLKSYREGKPNRHICRAGS